MNCNYFKEFFTDSILFVFAPAGLVWRNATMKKYFKNWISSKTPFLFILDLMEKFRNFKLARQKKNSVEPQVELNHLERY